MASLVSAGRRGRNVRSPVRHGEDQAALAEYRDRAAYRPTRNAEFLDKLQLTGNGPIRLPVPTLYSLGEDLGELEVRRDRPVRLDHVS